MLYDGIQRAQGRSCDAAVNVTVEHGICTVVMLQFLCPSHTNYFKILENHMIFFQQWYLLDMGATFCSNFSVITF